MDEAFFVAKDGGRFIKVINPKILSFGKRTKRYFEGCLSTPNIWGEVKRYTTIKVSYRDKEGKTITATLRGIPAWIFQHEIDHLNGTLFQDRVLEQKGKFYKFTGKDKAGADIFEEITLP
ncbi:peptide deformylase [Candidatus Daviesbacteria bacterium]|nr:peptide deformylase [Candidatus Daviesbacteria bacterium]